MIVARLKYFIFYTLLAFSHFSRSQQVSFNTPIFADGSMFSDKAAFLDFNNDGSVDVLTSSFLFGLFAIALDEDGNKVAHHYNASAPSFTSGTTVLPTVMNLKAGEFSGDHIKDLVAITNDGSLHLLITQASTHPERSFYSNRILVDNFSSVLQTPSLTAQNHFSGLLIDDFNNDNLPDILVAGSQINPWNAHTNPGFMYLYLNQGQYVFQKHSLNLPGNTIDLEYGDLNSDGIKDTLVLLTETGSVGAFIYEIHHARFNNGAFQFINASQILGTSKVTSFELLDINSDNFLDYVYSHNFQNGQLFGSSIYYQEGNGAGGILSSWGTIPVPQNNTGFGDHIESIRVTDINQDGYNDLLVLRGYTSGPTSTGTPQTSSPELFVYLGPNLNYSTPSSFALPGKYSPAWSASGNNMYFGMPLSSAASMIHIEDLGLDSSPDVIIQGISINKIVNGQPALVGGSVVLKNQAITGKGFLKTGQPSGSFVQSPRIAMGGGVPKIGNSNFSVDIQNVRPGSMVGVMWGVTAQANLFQAYGIEAHLIPTEYSSVGFAAGTAGPNSFDGFYSLRIPIPNIPALRGYAGHFQYNIMEPLTQNIISTQATGVNIE